ncbi:MAG: hypothetical protein ACXWUB_08900 [Burkholderiales bacterium]
MAENLQGFPFWLLAFEKDGKPTDAGAVDQLITGLKTEEITDLFIFSHGWNNDRTAALALYDKFFGEMRKVLDSHAAAVRPGARIGVAGVVWPSILWPDDAESASSGEVMQSGAGGGASLGGAAPPKVAQATPHEIRAELGKGYDDARQLALLDELTGMLETQQKTDAALTRFRQKLAELLDSDREGAAIDRLLPDAAEGAIGQLSDDKWRRLLDVLGTRALRGQPTTGGGAGIGDPFKKLWAGAKDALRIGTYWHMKERAGVVGRVGLGAGVLTRIANEAKDTRVHLLGHSFGARVVSFSLTGLPEALQGERSPVKSLFLMQGAFSHFAFADKLPHDATRSGALKGMAARVDGPLLATHSLRDLAVGRSYPAASVVNGDDAAAVADQVSRWGAIGNDGAQAVEAASEPLSAPGKAYPFKKGGWLNLDGNKVIIHGGLPSGAHSDIAHPHTAWAALAAAAIV